MVDREGGATRGGVESAACSQPIAGGTLEHGSRLLWRQRTTLPRRDSGSAVKRTSACNGLVKCHSVRRVKSSALGPSDAEIVLAPPWRRLLASGIDFAITAVLLSGLTFVLRRVLQREWVTEHAKRWVPRSNDGKPDLGFRTWTRRGSALTTMSRHRNKQTIGERALKIRRVDSRNGGPWMTGGIDEERIGPAFYLRGGGIGSLVTS